MASIVFSGDDCMIVGGFAWSGETGALSFNAKGRRGGQAVVMAYWDPANQR